MICFMRNAMSFYGLLLSQFLFLNSLLALKIYKSENKLNTVLKTPELINSHGYQVEIHNVITEDGYILEIHRLPCGQYDCEKNFAKRKRPVLIQHGLAGSSADWVLMGPDRGLGNYDYIAIMDCESYLQIEIFGCNSYGKLYTGNTVYFVIVKERRKRKGEIAYMLADAGFDVWLGNNRGNIYSRNHTTILPTDRNFWNFSYHELGIYDIPAIIDYILDRTISEKLFYIGHSQGSTQFWVTMSQKPNYNAKVKLMIGLAPVAFTGNIRGPITKLAKLTYLGVRIGEAFGYPELRSRSAWGKLVSNILCRDTTVLFCNNILFLVTGFKQTNLSATNLSTIMNHVPAGASWKQVVHFGQGYIHRDHFREFDYDNSNKNYEIYNSLEPPEYRLNKVTTPVALFSSDNDLLATKTDVGLLKSKLGNVVFHNEVSIKSFSHYDFIWGTSSMSVVFEPILKLLSFYE